MEMETKGVGFCDSMLFGWWIVYDYRNYVYRGFTWLMQLAVVVWWLEVCNWRDGMLCVATEL
jgi:hypothetical protein